MRGIWAGSKVPRDQAGVGRGEAGIQQESEHHRLLYRLGTPPSLYLSQAHASVVLRRQ